MTSPSKVPVAARYVLGLLLVLGITLAIFVLLLRPAAVDFGLMTLFLLITAFITFVVGYTAYKLGWLNFTPTLRWALIASYALSSMLTFINVWLTARLMFASRHDLMLATVLLIFAGGMAMILGVFLASALTDRIRLLEAASRKLAEGDLSARVPVQGRDEIATLTAAFNEMASQLQAIDQKQHELENLRSDLIAWIGHDLQTPLSSIRAILEALADGVVDDPPAVQRYLQTAQRDVRSLSLLIDDLFQMAQIDAGGLQLDLRLNSLSDLISDTLESFTEPANRQGLKLEGNAAPDVDPVRMDAARIGRVLNNLVGNALRSTASGGRVEVRAWREDGRVEVSVADTGDGIRPEDLPFIFERFYRGEKSRSRATGGAGLGLAIARGIVQAHGGDIQIESETGKGTRFIFWLP